MSIEDTDSRARHAWHAQINRHMDARRESGESHLSWMYMGKELAHEVPRMAKLHGMERRGELATDHVQCHNAACDSTPQPVPDNHLTCSLGVECRKCPHLLALDNADMEPEQIDQAKAWTCMAHIVAETKGQGDQSGEGWLQTVDDRMFWDRLYANLNTQPDKDDAEAAA